MAFKNGNLGVVAFCSGWTLWQYKSTDTLQETELDGYFNTIKDLCATGDIIILVCEGKVGKQSAIRAIILDNGVVKLTNLQ